MTSSPELPCAESEAYKSYSRPNTSSPTCPQNGIAVVVAAGNNNGGDSCSYSPASAPSAITVGSSNRDVSCAQRPGALLRAFWGGGRPRPAAMLPFCCSCTILHWLPLLLLSLTPLTPALAPPAPLVPPDCAGHAVVLLQRGRLHIHLRAGQQHCVGVVQLRLRRGTNL